jgi:hypothetical protein
MSDLKVFEVDNGEGIYYCGGYRSAGEAKADAAGLFSMEFTDVRVQRVPYLDPFELGGFEDECPNEAVIAWLRHGQGWVISDEEYLDPDELVTESDWEALCNKLSVTYPDRYKPVSHE